LPPLHLLIVSDELVRARLLPEGVAVRRLVAPANGDTTPAIIDRLLTATATQRQNSPTPVRTQRHLSFSSASESRTLRQWVLSSVTTLQLAVRGSVGKAAMDLATSVSETGISADYVNHGQDDGKR